MAALSSLHMFGSLFGRSVILILSDLVSVLLLAMGSPVKALAYVDPSVVIYTIQVLAGVAVILSAVLGVALRRTRRVTLRFLRIGENADKIIGPLAHRIAVDDVRRGEMLTAANSNAATMTNGDRGAPNKDLSSLVAGQGLDDFRNSIQMARVLSGRSEELQSCWIG